MPESQFARLVPTITAHDLLVVHLVAAYIWAVVSPGVIMLARRFPIEPPKAASRILIHLVLSLAFASGVIVTGAVLRVVLGIGASIITMSLAGSLAAGFVFAGHLHVFIYWAVVGVYHGIRYQNASIERERRGAALALGSAELKIALRRAQLHAVKAQLEPHFLFNTLNTILVLVQREREEDAAEMMRRLRELLARLFGDPNVEEIALDRELEYLRLYLAIEQVRFADRLRVEISDASNLRDAAVACMCLQPIVENAIRHGVARTSAPVTIRVRAAREGDALRLQVEDDGPGRSPFERIGGRNRRGIGLINTRARLETLYGDRASLNVEHPSKGGTIATIILPYRAVGSGGLAPSGESASSC